MATKFRMGDEVQDPYHCVKLYHDQICGCCNGEIKILIRGFRSPAPRLPARMSAHKVIRLISFFWGGWGFFSLEPRPLHRFLRSVHQMMCLRKDVLLGVPKTKHNISTLFSPKMQIVGQFLMRQKAINNGNALL